MASWKAQAFRGQFRERRESGVGPVELVLSFVNARERAGHRFACARLTHVARHAHGAQHGDGNAEGDHAGDDHAFVRSDPLSLAPVRDCRALDE